MAELLPAPSCPSSRFQPCLPCKMLHRFAKFVAGCTVLLILAGSLVTSTRRRPVGARLADELRLEHVHLPAVDVGRRHLLRARASADREQRRVSHDHSGRLALAGGPRRWLRWLGVVALGAVIVQGVLGGLTVLFFLPAAVSTAHAGLAEIFFCLTVAIALFTSRAGSAGYGRRRRVRRSATARGASATTTTALVYVQILLGATMRHTGAGLAIPDFPLMFGHSCPTTGIRGSPSTSRIASARSS